MPNDVQRSFHLMRELDKDGAELQPCVCLNVFVVVVCVCVFLFPPSTIGLFFFFLVSSTKKIERHLNNTHLHIYVYIFIKNRRLQELEKRFLTQARQRIKVSGWVILVGYSVGDLGWRGVCIRHTTRGVVKVELITIPPHTLHTYQTTNTQALPPSASGEEKMKAIEDKGLTVRYIYDNMFVYMYIFLYNMYVCV